MMMQFYDDAILDFADTEKKSCLKKIVRNVEGLSETGPCHILDYS